MTSRNILIVFLVLVTVTTLTIRIPIGISQGYFNFGDVAVCFGGLVAGHYLSQKNGIVFGGLIGGLGSAAADIIGGFGLFAPITFFAKGFEGACAGFAASRKTLLLKFVFLILGAIMMVITYFIGEYLMPSMGLAAAIGELLPNMVQATGGLLGGLLLFQVFKLIMNDDNNNEIS